MCGIAGFKIFKKKKEGNLNLLKDMTNLIAHRGPDSNGYWVSNPDKIFIGHRRLSILDLTDKGKQPMTSSCGRYVISYNGEVYNFQILKKMLEEKFSIKFNNNTDTQVILELISTLGIKKAISLIEGMFAFVVWDKKRKSLFLVRDRFGEKPLYYFLDSEYLVFGSELKVIERFFYPKKLNISSKGANYYSFLGYIPAPYSIYKNTYKVMPSELIEIKNERVVKKNKFFCINSSSIEKQKKCENITISEIKELVENSVKKMMIADVEVGCFLSGGIDSSLVASIMQKYSRKKIKTFTVGFNESQYDESGYAKKVAEHINSDHYQIKVSYNDILKNLEDVVNLFDEPFADSSFLPTYLISKFASKKVKVVLSGDGGDEIFLGYNRYLYAQKINRLKNNYPKALRFFFSKILKGVPLGFYDYFSKPFQKKFGIHALSHKIQKLSNIMNFNSNSEFYKKLNIINNDLIGKFLSLNDNLFENYEDLNITDATQRNDIDCYLANDILVKVDRSSMKNSLEVRSPFLDHLLVEKVFKISNDLKMKDQNLKFILKKILSSYLPKNLYDRPKMGFAIPIETWLTNKEMQNSLDQIFFETDWGKFKYEKKMIRKYWTNYKRFRSYPPHKIWAYVVAGLWINEH